ncbi:MULTISPECIES: nuclear transport factor 2 family protein [Nocardiopsidaceae]|uniref:Nuclear transport factor 2 family protein n=1 Tax=Streptomonospora nanhaiensis TaxID=1323731 RepID=A0ABY6YW22_9ACTN|nr:nuclear transport factor 2 family protein [Streptomonospora nanhaiensis]WAE76296.1 nuclear transport factor 2 family protein [Streptomonospora nanhaiensis]
MAGEGYGMEDGDGVERAIEGELRLLDPRVRASRHLAGELLDPEFTEVGRSGRRWNRQAILTELPTMDGPVPAGAAPVRVTGMAGRLVAPGVVHLAYTTDRGGVRALRSSLWRLNPDGVWRLYHHQGTPAA